MALRIAPTAVSADDTMAGQAVYDLKRLAGFVDGVLRRIVVWSLVWLLVLGGLSYFLVASL